MKFNSTEVSYDAFIPRQFDLPSWWDVSKRGCNSSPNCVGRAPERIVVEMRVFHRRRLMLVPEQLSDQRQSHSATGTDAGVSVPQVMDSDVLQSCVMAD
jgi:hypothetical protein